MGIFYHLNEPDDLFDDDEVNAGDLFYGSGNYKRADRFKHTAKRGSNRKKKKTNTGVIIAAVAAVCVIAAVLIFAIGKISGSGEDKFLEGTTINGVSVENMTADEAKEALEAAVNAYELDVNIAGGYLYHATAEDISLTLNENLDLQALIDAQTKDSDRELIIDDLCTADLTVFFNELGAYIDTVDVEKAEDASLVFDEEADEFVAVEGKGGYYLNADKITEDVRGCVERFVSEVSYELQDFYVTSTDRDVNADEIQEALAYANAYKDLTIEVVFTPSNGNTTYETITWEKIRNWLAVDSDGITIYVNDTELSSYVSDIASAHSLSYGTSQFKTSSGSYISVAVSRAGQSVNMSGLYEEIYGNVSNQIGGTIDAPYDETSEVSDVVDFGGSYVEVDLNNQKVYCYKDYSLVVATSCVSGKVSAGHATPAGVYTINAKQTDRYLTGEDYRSWVNYWMPFNGGIGLHDATWRSSFGGSTYIYSGSHGCVNLPLSAAATIYENVSVGTKVIVYGGETSAALLEQTLTIDSTSVNLCDGSTAKISASASTSITYSSSDTAVVTVDSDGNIEAVGEGTATITVTAEKSDVYNEKTGSVTVTVAAHDWGDWKWDGDGTKTHTRTCGRCEATETEECNIIDGKCTVCGHMYKSSSETTEPDDGIDTTEMPTTETEPGPVEDAGEGGNETEESG